MMIASDWGDMKSQLHKLLLSMIEAQKFGAKVSFSFFLKHSQVRYGGTCL
jgi:hypothetical protein